MLFGSEPGLGVNADTQMVKEITDVMLAKYEKKFFTLLLPDCFDDLFSADANVEMVASNTTQPLILLYIGNVVTRSVGLIFNNSYDYMFLGAHW